MRDGLYQVNWRGICAGFVVENGQVTMCAPVLRRRFAYFSRIAKRISNDETKTREERKE